MINEFFDVNNIAFTLFGYSISWLEFVGTLLNLLGVWLATRNRIISWPVGIVAVVMYASLFLQYKLYSDVIENGYYFITGFYGWWVWSRTRKENRTEAVVNVTRMTTRQIQVALAIVVAGTAVMSVLVVNLDDWLPRIFGAPASFLVLDALTTVASFVAQLLMARRKIENWIFWIAIDAVAVGLYLARDLLFVSIVFGLFLLLAVKGFIDWLKIMRNQGTGEPTRVPGMEFATQ